MAFPATASSAVYPSKHIRIGSSRSRTGCATCKIRRVKCDETKPSCKRCTSTGRKCDGYLSIPKPTAEGRDVQLRCNMQIRPGPLRSCKSPIECRAWDYFHHCCLEQVFGSSQFEWIKTLIAQLGQQEDAVNAAVVAFSSTHQASILFNAAQGIHKKAFDPYDNSALNPPDTATTAYHTAVALLGKAIDSRGRVAVPTVLVCCILFTALDMLSCEYDTAAQHMIQGIEIIAREQYIEKTSGSRCLPGWSTTATDGIMSTLVSSFYRLAIAAYFYGRPDTLVQGRIWTDACPDTSSGRVHFNSIDQAQQWLISLVGQTLKLAADVNEELCGGTIADEHFSRRSQLSKSLASWHTAFTSMTMTAPSTESIASLIRQQLMQIVLETQYISIKILLDTCFDVQETAYDAYFDEFRAILVLCDEYISRYPLLMSSEPQLETSSFTFDMEILPQLWFVGKKCRHPEYRRWCVALLAKYTCREGMWDPRLIHGLTSRVMEIEEANLHLQDTSLPAESDRLWHVSLEERFSNATIATFAYKPAELGGRDLCWDEMILFR